MADYTRFITTVKRLLKKRGTLAIVRRVVSDTLNDTDKPWRGKVSTGNTEDKSVYMAFLTIGKEGQETQHRMNQIRTSESSRLTVNSFTELGLAVLSVGTLVALMEPSDFVPTIRDVVIRGSEQYRIIAIDVLKPADQVVMYTLTLEV